MRLSREIKMKKQIIGRAVSIMLAFALIFNLNIAGAFSLENSVTQDVEQVKAVNKTEYQMEMKKVMDETANYVYNTVSKPAYGSIGGEWAIYGLSRAEYPMTEEYLDGYKQTIIDALEEGYRGQKGILHDKKYTDYSRVILAFSHLGWDVRNVGGYDLLVKLADFKKVIWQGINGPMWALIALDAGNHKIPEKEKDAEVQTTRQLLIDEVLKYQMSDGGWRYGVTLEDLDKNESESDMTAMAIRALAPYRNQKKVKKAVDRALDNLSKTQEDDGTYMFWDSKTSESCSQVICALSILGIDAKKDKRFIKNGNTVFDGLMSFYDEKTHGFKHVNKAEGGYQPVVNQMATEQALYALGEYWQADFSKTQSKIPTLKSFKVIVKRGKAVLGWNELKGVSGYEIMYSTDKDFNNSKKIQVKGKTYVEIKVQKRKEYYFKIRTFKIKGKKKTYGKFSTTKNVSTK